MLKTGLPLLEALNILSESTDDKSLRIVFKDAAISISRGSTFVSTLEKYPEVFDEMYVALVSAGEIAGLLDQVLDRESLLLESLSKIKGQIKSALAYPLAIFALTVIVVIIMLLFVIPVFVLVAFNAAVPLMTVVNYSFQETFGSNVFAWEGTRWFKEILHSERFHASLGRQVIFTFIILLIQLPLGIGIALSMPKKGWGVPVCLILMSMPLLIPWNVVGAMWNIFALPEIGFLGNSLNSLGFDYNFTQQSGDAWFTTILMDVWHWTSLVVLLSYAGLNSIQPAYYQAAEIDGASRWDIFRYIELPKMKKVLTLAILLRFMDSFMIYTEPFVLTGGGPGNATNFLSLDLVKMALGQFDLGPAAAMSLIYFLIVLLVCWICLLYTSDAADE